MIFICAGQRHDQMHFRRSNTFSKYLLASPVWSRYLDKSPGQRSRGRYLDIGRKYPPALRARLWPC